MNVEKKVVLVLVDIDMDNILEVFEKVGVDMDDEMEDKKEDGGMVDNN
jgi:hypothetical protein